MVIFKPSKYLLQKKIIKLSFYLTGKMLDAGFGGLDRYSSFFPKVTQRITLDVCAKYNPNILNSVEKIDKINNDEFDSVICTQVLGDVLSPQKALKEFFRILKPGGYLLISESFFNELHGEPFDYWRFTNYGLKLLTKEQGFSIVCIESYGGFFSTIAQMKIRYLIDRLGLYNKKILNIFFRLPIKLFGHFMIYLDKIDSSVTNKKFAIGWVVLAQKPKNP